MTDSKSFAGEFAEQALRGTPAIGMSLWSLNDLLIALSILYVLAQGAYLFWKWRREARAAAKADALAALAAGSVDG